MRTTLRRHVAGALGTLILTLAVPAPAAAAGASDNALDRAALADVLRAALATRHLGPGPDYRPVACTGPDYADGADGTPLDVRAYGLYYGCGDTDSWAFLAVTGDEWPSSRLDFVGFDADTDGNAATGCRGTDRTMLGLYDSGSQSLVAGVLTTPDCNPDNARVVARAGIGRGSSSSIALLVDAAAMGAPSVLRGFGYLSAVDEPGVDYVPKSGWISSPRGSSTGSGDACPPSVAGRYTATAAEPTVAEALVRAGARDVRRLHGGVLTVGTDQPVLLQQTLLAQGHRVELVPDSPLQQHASPNDPGFPTQWPLPAVGAEAAWARTTGSASVVVAVLDSGVDAAHTDLQGRLAPGYDAVTATAMSGNSDADGHGTATAGVVAAATDNGAGLSSLGWNTTVLPVKVGDGGGSASSVAAGLRYAADRGAAVANISLGGCTDNPVVKSAVDYAVSRGVLVVASAGNGKQKGNPVEYPAAYPDVLAVGATGFTGEVAAYSNTGAYVDIAAPGGSGDGNPAHQVPLLRSGGGTRSADGTSFSAPLVAAAAALVKAVRPAATAADLRAFLTSTATDRGPAGRDDAYGSGVLDAGRAVTAAAPVDQQPTTPPPPPPPPPSAPAPDPQPQPEPARAAVVELAPSARIISAGQSIALRGRVEDQHGAAFPGAGVTLLGNDGTGWRGMLAGRADGSGLYSFAVRPAASTRYAVRSGGVQSPLVGVAVRTRVTLSSPRAGAVPATVTFTGSTTPARPGQVVRVLVGPAGRQTELGRARTGQDGRFRVTVRPARGRHLYTVLAQRTTGVEQGTTTVVLTRP